MKLTIRRFLFGLLFLGVAAACDVLHDDAPQEYDVQLLTDKVFVSELQSSTVISLNALIRAKVPVKFSIAEGTHRGKLDISDISQGIIRYDADYGVIQPDDFKFSVTNENSQTVTQQQVSFVLADERDDIPCGSILTFNDHFINLGAPGSVVTLDVLKNDWMCDEMKSQIQLVTEDGWGNATVTPDNKILYTVPPDTTGQGDQYGWYRIELKSNPAIRWYASYRLTFSDVCELGAGYIEDNDPTDNLFGYTLPLATAPTIKFNPLTSASLCGYALSEIDVTVIHQPKFGSVTVHPSKSFSYTPTNTTRETYTDLLIYKISLPNGKWVNQILRLRLVNGNTCTQGAVDDVMGVENAIYPMGGHLLPVTHNDCNWKTITSIRIVSPPAGGATAGKWLGSWSIMYNPPNLNKNPDVMQYEATYQDGTTSTATVYVQPYDVGN